MGRLEEIAERSDIIDMAPRERASYAIDDIPWLLAEVAWLRGYLIETIHGEWHSSSPCEECATLEAVRHDD